MNDSAKASRMCPACRKNLEDNEDAKDHSQKCLDLIKDQEDRVKGGLNVSALSSNGNEVVKSRPSCSVCGKAFKVRPVFGVNDLYNKQINLFRRHLRRKSTSARRSTMRMDMLPTPS